jgi:multidrug resistance efflux pump
VIALGAPSFGIVALSRGENVNAAWLVIAAVCIYLIAYRLKGHLLMVIDPTNYNIAVSRDAAAVQQAQANMENAAKDAKRRQELSDLAVIKGSAAEMPPAHLRLARSGWRKQLRIIHRGRSFQEDNRGLETRSCRCIELSSTSLTMLIR